MRFPPASRTALLALAALALLAPAAAGFHWYRNNTDTCTEVDTSGGPVNLGDAPSYDGGATVRMLHTTFDDTATHAPVSVISAGQSVTWTWTSLHCHSVTQGSSGDQNAAAWQSGMRWPSQEGAVQGVQGSFDYPLPELAPQLSYTKVFDTPGVYAYSCHHHWYVGMQGFVVVV